MDDLIDQWNSGKERAAQSASDPAALIARAEKKKKSSRAFHIGNIAILSVTCLLLLLFFRTVAPVQEPLSLLAVGLMVTGLIIRIVIELISERKLAGIDLGHDTLQANARARAFYRFRKTVHGPVTIAIVIAYCVGVGLLLPEFSKYIPSGTLALYYGGFVVWGLVFIFFIRKKIKKEVASLETLGRIGDAHRAE